MNDNLARPQPDSLRRGELRAAISPPFTLLAEPQTRLFWD